MKIVITGGVASAAENPSLNSKRTVRREFAQGIQFLA